MRLSFFWELIKFNGILLNIRMLIDLIYSLLNFRIGAFLRFPSEIRSRGCIQIGKNCRFGRYSTIELFNKDSLLKVGDGFRSNSYLHIGVVSSVTIGTNVLVASGVFISDHSHGYYSRSNSSSPNIPPVLRPLMSSPIVIGDNVWIGEKVTILPGVNVGRGVIIGAGCVVTDDIQEYSIVVGVPARIIKHYDFTLEQWVKI